MAQRMSKARFDRLGSHVAPLGGVAQIAIFICPGGLDINDAGAEPKHELTPAIRRLWTCRRVHSELDEGSMAWELIGFETEAMLQRL